MKFSAKGSRFCAVPSRTGTVEADTPPDATSVTGWLLAVESLSKTYSCILGLFPSRSYLLLKDRSHLWLIYIECIKVQPVCPNSGWFRRTVPPAEFPGRAEAFVANALWFKFSLCPVYHPSLPHSCWYREYIPKRRSSALSLLPGEPDLWHLAMYHDY